MAELINNGDSGFAVRTKLNELLTVFPEWDATGNVLPVDGDGVGSGTDGALKRGDEFSFGPGGGTIDGELWPENTIAKYLGSGNWRLY
jgi:hypothetical protein